VFETDKTLVLKVDSSLTWKIVSMKLVQFTSTKVEFDIEKVVERRWKTMSPGKIFKEST